MGQLLQVLSVCGTRTSFHRKAIPKSFSLSDSESPAPCPSSSNSLEHQEPLFWGSF